MTGSTNTLGLGSQSGAVATQRPSSWGGSAAAQASVIALTEREWRERVAAASRCHCTRRAAANCSECDAPCCDEHLHGGTCGSAACYHARDMRTARGSEKCS